MIIVFHILVYIFATIGCLCVLWAFGQFVKQYRKIQQEKQKMMIKQAVSKAFVEEQNKKYQEQIKTKLEQN